MSAAVRFVRVSRLFGAVRAVDDVSFEVRPGEFFAMLGPSGSGKTTSLRLIAGFEQPTKGHIEIHGKAAEGVPPYERDVNTVFQDYALFPHMSVIDNVSYGLMVKGTPKHERYARAEEMLALVRLEGMEDRRPSQLSGGQRQRVALARALINRPRVLLLDEPLGALDLKLREQMQVELKALQRKLGVTFIFVTHDQEEALSMSDRLAVFNQGRIEQIGTPEEVYERPATRFVAGFVGLSNVIEAPLARRLTGAERVVSLRPEKILVVSDPAEAADGQPSARGIIAELQYHGAYTRIEVETEQAGRLIVVRHNRQGDLPQSLAPGQPVCLSWRHEDMRPLDEAVEATP